MGWEEKVLTQVTVEMSGISMTKEKGTVPKHWTLVDKVFSQGVWSNKSNTATCTLKFNN